MNSWKDSYDRVVAQIIAGRKDISLDELCDRLDLLRDEVEAITDRLEARDVIHQRDQIHPDMFNA